MQTLRGYFGGRGVPIPFSCEENAVFSFQNPIDSNVNLVITRTRVANLSNAGINVYFYIDTPLYGKLYKSPYTRNLITTNTPDARLPVIGDIYYGTNIKASGLSHLEQAIPPYTTLEGNPNFPLIVGPGMNQVISVTPIYKGDTGMVNFSLDWREQSIK
ncbi:hypothetical protein A374_03039 [Fictibacillus macauensis ZFHKF-1]|uniref:Uncharacterized protein n=1 Tax=Fictibacillus macauensis ZFHKF-1 TaxID=1196324 RepID=I8AKZ1_9BACL|nr:DUF6143 family protein [Fictibacillus macauensis]EIT86512.1 hypothetical protein A374_03039 [Fictibacillus macauensis ZFHKF-1]